MVRASTHSADFSLIYAHHTASNSNNNHHQLVFKDRDFNSSVTNAASNAMQQRPQLPSQSQPLRHSVSDSERLIAIQTQPHQQGLTSSSAVPTAATPTATSSTATNPHVAIVITKDNVDHIFPQVVTAVRAATFVSLNIVTSMEDRLIGGGATQSTAKTAPSAVTSQQKTNTPTTNNTTQHEISHINQQNDEKVSLEQQFKNSLDIAARSSILELSLSTFRRRPPQRQLQNQNSAKNMSGHTQDNLHDPQLLQQQQLQSQPQSQPQTLQQQLPSKINNADSMSLRYAVTNFKFLFVREDQPFLLSALAHLVKTYSIDFNTLAYKGIPYHVPRADITRLLLGASVNHGSVYKGQTGSSHGGSSLVGCSPLIMPYYQQKLLQQQQHQPNPSQQQQQHQQQNLQLMPTQQSSPPHPPQQDSQIDSPHSADITNTISGRQNEPHQNGVATTNKSQTQSHLDRASVPMGWGQAIPLPEAQGYGTMLWTLLAESSVPVVLFSAWPEVLTLFHSFHTNLKKKNIDVDLYIEQLSAFLPRLYDISYIARDIFAQDVSSFSIDKLTTLFSTLSPNDSSHPSSELPSNNTSSQSFDSDHHNQIFPSNSQTLDQQMHSSLSKLSNPQFNNNNISRTNSNSNSNDNNHNNNNHHHHNSNNNMYPSADCFIDVDLDSELFLEAQDNSDIYLEQYMINSAEQQINDLLQDSFDSPGNSVQNGMVYVPILIKEGSSKKSIGGISNLNISRHFQDKLQEVISHGDPNVSSSSFPKSLPSAAFLKPSMGTEPSLSGKIQKFNVIKNGERLPIQRSQAFRDSFELGFLFATFAEQASWRKVEEKYEGKILANYALSPVSLSADIITKPSTSSSSSNINTNTISISNPFSQPYMLGTFQLSSQAYTSLDRDTSMINVAAISIAERFIDVLLPTYNLLEARQKLFESIAAIIKKALGGQAFVFGPSATNTFLADSILDIGAFLVGHERKSSNWCSKLMVSLCESCVNLSQSSQDRNTDSSQSNQESYLKTMRNISFASHNDSGDAVTLEANGIKVRISANQVLEMSMTCFLEEVDRLLGKNHLFKRGLLLVHAWCMYGSRILDLDGLSPSAVNTLVLYIVNIYHASLETPLDIFIRFIRCFATLEWSKYGICIFGTVNLANGTFMSNGKAFIPLKLFHTYSRRDWESSKDSLDPQTDEPETDAQTEMDRLLSRLNPSLDSVGIGVNIFHPLDGTVNQGILRNREKLIKISEGFGRGLRSLDKFLAEPTVANLNAIFGSTFKAHIAKWKAINSNLADLIERAMVAPFISKDGHNSSEFVRPYDLILSSRYLDGFVDQDPLAVELTVLKNNLEYVRFIVDAQVTELGLLAFLTQVLAENGSLLIGEVGQHLRSTFGKHDWNAILKDRFGGLKKFLLNHSDLFYVEKDHPLNPHISLRTYGDPQPDQIPTNNAVDSRGLVNGSVLDPSLPHGEFTPLKKMAYPETGSAPAKDKKNKKKASKAKPREMVPNARSPNYPFPGAVMLPGPNESSGESSDGVFDGLLGPYLKELRREQQRMSNNNYA